MTKLIKKIKYTLKIEVNYANGTKEVHTPESAKTCFILGRSNVSDIMVDDDDISRKHLLIEVEDDKIFITDLDSTNGSIVAGQKLSPNLRSEYSVFFVPIKLGPNVTVGLSLVEHSNLSVT